MFELKNYQQRSLDDLTQFLRRAGEVGAKTAFIEQTERPYKTVKHFPELPYVCLRIPTGGGKTLMAAHAVGIAAREFSETDAPTCLWLVPTNAIREQTLMALRDRSHPYRQALASRVSSPVSILDLSEALSVQPGTLKGETVVIVATLAALRVGDTEGRKVYETAGALMSHFSEIAGPLDSVLERSADGTIPYSLANVLRLHRPIVIMDEAHNARTPLSFDTLARFHPGCVLEFTATPETTHAPEQDKFASNVLCHVSAAELKVEQMVKLPIWLETRPDWRELVSEALAKRATLEALAVEEERETGEYIRPVILLQAQPKSKTKETITVHVLRRHLIEDCKIPEEQIKLATGEDWELDGVDLFDRNCPVRFILTVAALKEGWDCSYAYVLCSVADIGTARSVEQILGRVLRLPRARSKSRPELNAAYAFVASNRFLEAAAALKDALVQNGFEKVEASHLVVHSPASQPPLIPEGRLFGETTIAISETPNLEELPVDLRKRVTVDPQAGTLTVAGTLSAGDVKVLEGAFATPRDRESVRRLGGRSSGQPLGVARDERTFSIPLLTIRREDGRRELFEDQFKEFPWKLADCDDELSEVEFPTDSGSGQVGQIDVSDQGRIDIQFTRHLRGQMRLVGFEPGWDLPNLAIWLDRQIPHPDIVPAESRQFIYRALERLCASRRLSAAELAPQKYRLRGALAAKIEGFRRQQNGQSFQRMLFDSTNVVVDETPLFCFQFEEGRYAPNFYCESRYAWRKHLFPYVGDLPADGEEHDCAVFLDELPEVKWWVRNVERKPTSSFWLQTSTDRFYPDFVALLTDGRRLVVEYKGEDRWSNDDSREKRRIGELWAAASDGHCLFVMPKGRELTVIASAVRS